MKTPPTKFEVQVNGKVFANATVNLEDQLEVNLVSVAGQEAAVLAVTAFIPDADAGKNYVHSEKAAVTPGDTITIMLSAAEGYTATSVGPPSEEFQRESYNEDEMICSFCGKGQLEVAKMIASTKANICDECVLLCHGMVTNET